VDRRSNDSNRRSSIAALIHVKLIRGSCAAVVWSSLHNCLLLALKNFGQQARAWFSRIAMSALCQ
jgi:hypothetical protein